MTIFVGLIFHAYDFDLPSVLLIQRVKQTILQDYLGTIALFSFFFFLKIHLQHLLCRFGASLYLQSI